MLRLITSTPAEVRKEPTYARKPSREIASPKGLGDVGIVVMDWVALLKIATALSPKLLTVTSFAGLNAVPLLMVRAPRRMPLVHWPATPPTVGFVTITSAAF